MLGFVSQPNLRNCVFLCKTYAVLTPLHLEVLHPLIGFTLFYASLSLKDFVPISVKTSMASLYIVGYKVTPYSIPSIRSSTSWYNSRNKSKFCSLVSQ
ncbi:hypothetical protein F7734_11025 [Scytonema sp. UIC 10036]|nr:hypothetical protein [Scytonema sp. UIC 10036]